MLASALLALALLALALLAPALLAPAPLALPLAVAVLLALSGSQLANLADHSKGSLNRNDKDQLTWLCKCTLTLQSRAIMAWVQLSA